MTRARCYALAVLVGVCCLGQAPLYAQMGPAPAGYGDPAGLFPVDDGYPVDQPLAPVTPDTWYGTADQLAEASGRYGPIPVNRGWWLRAEYLNWQVRNPGNELLGSPLQGISDPTKPFLVFAPGSAIPGGIATVPTTQSIDLTNISGIRATAGMDLIYGGQVEVSAFLLARKQSGFVLPLGQPLDATGFGFPGTSLPAEVATSTFFQGQLSDHLLLYNQSYQAIFQTQLWGAEANYLADTMDPDGIIQMRPLIGARYINLSERLTQRGTFQDVLLGGPPVVSTIDSLTMNNLYGGQIGLRTQVVSKWFEAGITPKLLFLGNTMLGTVYTNNLRSNLDGTFASTNVTSAFSFGLEAQTYVQLNIAPRVSVRLGYDLLYLTRVTRPQSNIYYNDNGSASAPGITEQTIFKDILINGWSVAMQIQF